MDAQPRVPLSRDRVLRAAVALADEARDRGAQHAPARQELGVVPMALYKHVANKDELLDGMVDVVVGRDRPAGRRDRLEGGHPAAGPLGPAARSCATRGRPG